jgi:hypothetical protein
MYTCSVYLCLLSLQKLSAKLILIFSYVLRAEHHHLCSTTMHRQMQSHEFEPQLQKSSEKGSPRIYSLFKHAENPR